MRNKLYLIFFSIMIIFFLAACAGGESDKENNISVNNNAAENVGQTDENNENVIDEEEENGIVKEESPADEVEVGDKSDKGQLTVHFIDVGQAEATLFEYISDQEEYRILYDTGNWNKNDVVQYLQANGVTSLDILVGTHIDADHIGQMDRIIDKVDVGEVWMTGDIGTSQTFIKALDAIERHDVDYHEPRAGEVYDIGPLVIEILHPTTLSSNTNSNSISMKLTYKSVSLVLTGDADVANEASMIAKGFDLDGTILQLGHHGSKTSTSEKFLLKVDPEVAIYSAGVGNSYGHPSEEVVSLINKHEIDLYGTDRHGTIVLTTDGESYTISTERDGSVKLPPTNTSFPTPNKTDESQESDKNTQANEKAESPSTPACIDINSAPLDEVQKIIHIGPVRAEELVKNRPYDSVDNLTKIKGIGPARLRDIKDQNIACIGG